LFLLFDARSASERFWQKGAPTLDLEKNWGATFLHEYIKLKVGVGAMHFRVPRWCIALVKIQMDIV
jgi:hypothetical protein